MRSRKEKVDHDATPMPGRRVLRSANRSHGNSGTGAPTTMLTKATVPAPDIDKVDEGEEEVAPMFHDTAEKGLVEIRRILDDRKAKIAEKTLELKKQLAGQLELALKLLPEEDRKMKVKDFDAKFGCDVIAMITMRAMEIFQRLDDGVFVGADDGDCPATIRREAGPGQRLPSKPFVFQTPAGKPSNTEFWSTAAKKKTGRGGGGGSSKTGGDSPDEKILTISKKKGAILETCGIDLLTLAHDPEKAGTLDVASLENIQKLHQLSSMILEHREKYNQRGIGLLGAVAEDEMEE